MTWSSPYHEDIVESFTSFCQERFYDEVTPEADEFFTSLGDYIAVWLYFDEGAKWTSGSFTGWLEAILIIIDAYGKDPSIIDYKGGGLISRKDQPPKTRRVERILDLEEWGADFVDEHIYRSRATGAR